MDFLRSCCGRLGFPSGGGATATSSVEIKSKCITNAAKRHRFIASSSTPDKVCVYVTASLLKAEKFSMSPICNGMRDPKRYMYYE